MGIYIDTDGSVEATLTQQQMLGRAFSIAANSHRDQLDKGGKAYILHPMRVMLKVGSDPELQQMAIMHDVLEDCTDLTEETLKEFGYSDRVVAGLSCLTHADGESYEDYIKRVSTNRDAILVKMADLEDNSQITRLKGLRDKDFERMKKYNKAYTFLKNTLKNMEACSYG